MKLTKEQKIKLYNNMVRVRKLDELLQKSFLVTHEIRSIYIAQEGQEAVGVGSCTFLNKDDYIFFSHRGMGIAKSLPKGVLAKAIVAEFYGKATGTCRSLSGHRTAHAELGISGPSGSVGMDLPLAAGVGIAARQRGKRQVVLSFFGDGAMNQGTFHTSILMSANWKLPVVWICENNGYFGPTPVKEHYPKDNIADLAFGYGIPGVVVDGQDVLAVYEVVQTAIDRARAGEGPSLIECKTICFAEDIYTGPRNMDEARKNKDPIKLYQDRLFKEGVLTQADVDRIDREATEEIEEADHFAKESPLPSPDILKEALYAD